MNIAKFFDKDKNNRKIIAQIIYRIFSVQKLFTDIVNVNQPDVEPCLYAMWHGHQCCVHGLEEKSKCNVLISRSRDGQIIGEVVENWGFNVIYGSKGKKGSVEASLQMIHALQNGQNCAMMVDGPKGPAKIVKDGVVKLAKKAQVPIVPIYWYSPNITFLKFNSWDSFRIPFFWTKLINLYGEPIYVDKNNTKEQDEEIRLKIQSELERLEKEAPSAFKKVFRFGLWRKRIKK